MIPDQIREKSNTRFKFIACQDCRNTFHSFIYIYPYSFNMNHARFQAFQAKQLGIQSSFTYIDISGISK